MFRAVRLDLYTPPFFFPDLEYRRPVARVRDDSGGCCDENLTGFAASCRSPDDLVSIASAVKYLPVWTFDGSSTGQANGHNSDTFLLPRALYRDPFRRGNHVIVMCDTYKYNMEPTESNNRVKCQEASDKCKDEEPWFGIEQEYILLDSDLRPFGWPPGGFPPPQGPYYCGVGANKVFARDLVEAHYR
ncbi:Glutamine synthetase 2 cytoplasmic [Eumeta japonica]|uniref:Glutamine synthetase 2 cytoplasmic n=1 Tax=Eumeta variegata TaxID=151549 RepID=A0A4C1TQI7_EUMVA|nr:Glutamine synthetase 2 cytoplasmic [Eumeta japonica]